MVEEASDFSDFNSIGPDQTTEADAPSAALRTVPLPRFAVEHGRGVTLRPAHDVRCCGQRFISTSIEPWLEIEASLDTLAGRFVDITYRSSFWDEPMRPVFRFWRDDGSRVDRIAAGPIAGAGIWTGRVPAGTRRIEVGPTNRPGPFGFRIERIRPLPWLAVVARGFWNQPRRARSALLTRLIGWAPESDVNLAWATGAIPLSRFSAWRTERARELDLSGLDAPRFDWSTTPIKVIIGEEEAGLVRRSLASLSAQVFPHWTATISPRCGVDPDDPRVRVAPDEAVADPDGLLTCRIEAGDVLVPAALAYVAEQAHRYPSCRLFYADAVLIDGNGAATPCLYPGWSPRLFAARPPRNALIIVRDSKSWPLGEQRRDDARYLLLPLAREGDTEPDEVRALGRLLLETRPKRSPATPGAPAPSRQTTASIIIPTRDQAALLRRIVDSIQTRTSPLPQIVIVDNGSTSDPTRRLLAEFARNPDIVCLPHPGTFNFSAMCNAGAATAAGDVLVFLNDDTEVLTPDWLDRLVALAIEPTIGAVGARLTFPDGRLQHVGVVLGMGGSAGHFGALAAADHPGWAGRNLALHEVSAVTGACLAVERKKFEAVGGFDAEHLPVELSDIDICLKLNARGWQSVVDPAVHLMHEESASRGGATFRRLDVYAEQRAVFVQRCRHVLRDDPFFHPGLSLYSFEPALA